MKENVQPAYKGSEVDYPTVTGMICHSCITNIKVFVAHKPKYTKAFVQEILDRSKAAGLIPNQEQRQSKSTSLNNVVAEAAGICADNFPTLVSYMKSVFDESALPGMTTSFPGKCIEDSNAFSTTLDAYEEYKGIAEQQRQDKVNANNAVYKSLKVIMKDGKYIYRKDDALRKQFTYSAVLAKVTKNNRSGFTIHVNAPETSKMVTTAALRLPGYPDLFKASKKGIITAKVPEGTYTGVITAPGYQPLQVTFISDKGVTHREEVTLSVAVAIAM